jgi:hypothetical protein
MTKQIEIKEFTDIDKALAEIDKAATEAIKLGSAVFIELTTDSERSYTKKQRGALHVWCDQVAAVLNNHGMYFARRIKFSGDEVDIDWDGYLVKQHIYKPLLESMTGKQSTEDQSTVEPSGVASTLIRHFGLKHGLALPDWPSLR